MKLKTKESLTGLAFGLPAIVGLLAFFVIPFTLSFYYSINTVNLDTTVWYSHYTSVLSSAAFQLAAKNTAKFILFGVPLIVVTSFLTALMLRSSTASVSFIRSALVLPLVVPIASVILVFKAFFEDKGFINRFLSQLGVQPVSWLYSESAFFVLLLLYIWKNCGYSMVLFIAGLSGISKEYYEAGRIDGATERQMLLYITIPQLAPTFSFVVFVSIINAFKIFREAYILSGAYPDKSIYMIQHFMNNNFQNLSYQRLSVSAIMTFAVVVVCILTMLVISSRNKESEQ